MPAARASYTKAAVLVLGQQILGEWYFHSHTTIFLTCTPIPPWMILGIFMLSSEMLAPAARGARATLFSGEMGELAERRPVR